MFHSEFDIVKFIIVTSFLEYINKTAEFNENLHYRLIFDLDKSRRRKRNSREEPFKSNVEDILAFIIGLRLEIVQLSAQKW